MPNQWEDELKFEHLGEWLWSEGIQREAIHETRESTSLRTKGTMIK